MSASRPDDLPSRALFPFLLLAFGLAWGVMAVLAVWPERVTALFGPVSGRNPLFILAVYAPAISALALVAWWQGPGGLGRFLSRLALWRCSAGWYGFLLLLIPLLFVAGALIKGVPAGPVRPGEGWGALPGLLLLTLIIGPVEEFGWRGVALPILQRHMAPLWAGLVLGLVWGLWHLPAFFLSGTPQSAWPFLPFLVASAAASVIVTPMFNAARGSILLPALFHFQLNNPLWPDAQPWDALVFALAALAVVWANRGTMLRRGAAVTRVVPGPQAGGGPGVF